MKLIRPPFNIAFLNSDLKRLSTLLPVKSLDIYSNDSEFHPQGLFSNIIFGEINTPDRMKKHGFIDIKTTIMHPKYFQDLCRIKGLYGNIMSGKDYAVWDDKEKDFIKSDIVDGETGYSFFMSHMDDIVLKGNQSSSRDLKINLVEKYRHSQMYRYIVVLPAGLRDISIDETGKVTQDDINKLYRKLLRGCNALASFSDNMDDAVLNNSRWNLQYTFNEIYDYIEMFFSGKKGFWLAGVAARAIHGSTRNVITATEMVSSSLDSPDAVEINDSKVGVYQFMMGTIDLMVYHIKSGIASRFISAIPGSVPLVDRKTLKHITREFGRSDTLLSKDIITKWGSEDGIAKSINKFVNVESRHNPVEIQGDYLALIYRDEEEFFIIYDIDDTPEKYDRSLVRPITWGELFYITAYPLSKKLHGFMTRYPISEDGSVYPTTIYLKSTLSYQSLKRIPIYGDEIIDFPIYPLMPITGDKWFDSLSPHTSRLDGAGADFDGDMETLTILLSKESNEEVKLLLDDIKTYVSANNTLIRGITNKSLMTRLVIHNFTGSEK